MECYEHGGDIYGNPDVVMDFSVNTNPFGMPESIRQTFISRIGEFEHYPDPKCRELCAAIAGHELLPQEWVSCGSGAADLIYRLCQVIKPQKALLCAPTFSEYERALNQVECQITYHALSEENDFALIDEIIGDLEPDIQMLFLCHPNNPTGRLIPDTLLECILQKAKKNGTVVVVDECFLDFTGGISAKRFLAAMPELVVLKAFTKMYAVAGLRLGYLLASDKTLHMKLFAAAQCWSVSVPAQIAGVAALECSSLPGKTRRLIIKERRFLSDSLAKLGILVFPSDANFLLIKSKKPLYEPLLKKKILIRHCGNFRGLNDFYYRICVKTRTENKYLIQAIEEVIHG